MSGIFVAYRKSDAGAWASLLSDQLVAAYGDDRVFLDRDRLETGGWQQQIETALARCSVALIVIGPRWLTAVDENGEICLRKPVDVHRREIEIALAGRATVIPLLVGGAAMPRKQDLPPSIAALADWQARPLSETRRHRTTDLRTLMSDIQNADASLVPGPVDGPRPTVFGSVLRLVLMTVIASIALVVTAQVALGWTFRAEDLSGVTVIVFVALLAAWWVRARVRRGTRSVRS